MVSAPTHRGAVYMRFKADAEPQAALPAAALCRRIVQSNPVPRWQRSAYAAALISSRTAAKTSSNIPGVSRPVFVL